MIEDDGTPEGGHCQDHDFLFDDFCPHCALDKSNARLDQVTNEGLKAIGKALDELADLRVEVRQWRSGERTLSGFRELADRSKKGRKG